MSIWAPNWSWALPAFWICGANPICAARFMPASLPRASNVAKAGSRPVRTLLYVRDLPVAAELSSCENTQKAFTFPENENDQPLDICIVRPCALAVAETPRAKPNNNSVRRFIRESLLGSLPAAILPLVPSRRQCDCPAPGTAEWEGSPTSQTRLASHLQLWEQTGETGAHLLESESIVLCRAAGRPHQAAPASARHFRSHEARVSPQEWPPMTACELSPKPRDEPTCRPPHGPEPRKILGRTPPCPQ